MLTERKSSGIDGPSSKEPTEATSSSISPVLRAPVTLTALSRGRPSGPAFHAAGMRSSMRRSAVTGPVVALRGLAFGEPITSPPA